MSVKVELEDLQARLAEYGPVAFLVTVGDDSRPHVVSVRVQLDDGELVTGAGRTTAGNIGARPDATLLWPSPPGGDYGLIVDGPARVRDADGEGEGQEALIEPVRAVLHRLADAAGTGPGCVTILDQRAG
jgi:hypothetical protein